MMHLLSNSENEFWKEVEHAPLPSGGALRTHFAQLGRTTLPESIIDYFPHFECQNETMMFPLSNSENEVR
jgi:hypothetical protein